MQLLSAFFKYNIEFCFDTHKSLACADLIIFNLCDALFEFVK